MAFDAGVGRPLWEAQPAQNLRGPFETNER